MLPEKIRVFRLRNGLTFRARNQDIGTIQEVYVYRRYGDIKFRKGDAVIDVGASIGDFSALAAKSGASVIAYELEETERNLFNENMKVNGLAAELRGACTTLENVDKCDVLKMDVEGAEYDLIPTIPFNRIKPRIITLEYHEYPDKIKNFLEARGYKVKCYPAQDERFGIIHALNSDFNKL